MPLEQSGALAPDATTILSGDGDLGVERDRLGGRSRAEQQPPLFRMIQVWPKDRLTLPPAGWKCGKPTAPMAVAGWYDRRRHPWEGAPMSDMRRREFISLLGSAATVGRSAPARSSRRCQ